jgi:hypothetical protein
VGDDLEQASASRAPEERDVEHGEELREDRDDVDAHGGGQASP